MDNADAASETGAAAAATATPIAARAFAARAPPRREGGDGLASIEDRLVDGLGNWFSDVR